MQISQDMAQVAGANVVVLRPRRRAAASAPSGSLSPAAMARHLRETNPMNARCFALEMQDQAAWANEAWGEYWGDVARLV